MQNPLLTQRRSALDLPAAHGMNNYEWALAKARMDRAMMLGDFTLRLADRTRAALRSAAIALFGAPAPKRT
jgi:hypothetical protein